MKYFRLLRFIDKNYTIGDQIIYLKSYLLALHSGIFRNKYNI